MREGRVVVVAAHGAILASQGISSVAPALPSCGETASPLGAGGSGFAADVAAVRAAVLSDSKEPTIVVAHSYGGMVTAEAAADIDGVQHLVYVSSYLPEPGQSLSSFAGDEPAPFLQVDADAGTFAVRMDMFQDTFMHDCPADVAAESVHHLSPQDASIAQHPVQAAAWTQVPSTYLVCAADRGTPADKQREFARRATRVVELDTGHHPFLAKPHAVADLILQLP